MPTLNEVCCARLPIDALASLGPLRTHPSLRALPLGDTLWLTWPVGDDAVVEFLFALARVELFVEHADNYYRLDQHLPTFDVPDLSDAKSLAHFLSPEPLEPSATPTLHVHKLALRVVRDEQPRPTTAWLGELATFADWAELATTAQFVGLQAAIHDRTVFVVGSPIPWLEGVRYWGASILVPVGHRIEPTLPSEVLADVVGLNADELALFSQDGVEIIPRDVLSPVSRASVRLAHREETS